MPGAKPRSSARAASTLSHRVISPATLAAFQMCSPGSGSFGISDFGPIAKSIKENKRLIGLFPSTVVNQDGQPLIEGKLKEKQVRWKLIRRWKTRYFTLAGSQLLFQKGKSVSFLDTFLNLNCFSFLQNPPKYY